MDGWIVLRRDRDNFLRAIEERDMSSETSRFVNFMVGK